MVLTSRALEMRKPSLRMKTSAGCSDCSLRKQGMLRRTILIEECEMFWSSPGPCSPKRNRVAGAASVRGNSASEWLRQRVTKASSRATPDYDFLSTDYANDH